MNNKPWSMRHPLVLLIETATYLMRTCSVLCPSALWICLECSCKVGINNLSLQMMLSLIHLMSTGAGIQPRYVWTQSPCSFYRSETFWFTPQISTNVLCILLGFQSIRPALVIICSNCSLEKRKYSDFRELFDIHLG